MFRKPKFRPVITKVKLNPEQAVLSCCDQNVRGSAFPPDYKYNCDDNINCPPGGPGSLASS